VLKHCAENRKRRFSALPYVGPYTTLKFLALQGAPHIYDISRLRVNYHNVITHRPRTVGLTKPQINNLRVTGSWGSLDNMEAKQRYGRQCDYLQLLVLHLIASRLALSPTSRQSERLFDWAQRSVGVRVWRYGEYSAISKVLLGM
jgi:hypothetical protein